MKYLILLLTPLIVLASESTLTPNEHNSIHGYNNRPVVKMQKRRNMHILHKIDEKEVAVIASQETNEEIQSIKLTHTGNILKYLVKTKNYTLSINALDGAILNKIKK